MSLKSLIVQLNNTVIVTTGDKGGVGKTTVTQAVLDTLLLNSIPYFVAQVDRQDRLAQMNQVEVLTIPSDPEGMTTDPESEFRRFGPLMDLIIGAAGDGTAVVDLGANELDRFCAWAKLSDLDGAIEDTNQSVVALVVFNAEEQSIVQAGKSIKAITDTLSMAQVVLVENQRFGRINDLAPGSDVAVTYAREIGPFLKRYPKVTVPAVRGNSYQRFEHRRLSFGAVAVMSPAQIMEITGLGMADARIARGDIAKWLEVVSDQFEHLLGMK